MAARVRFAFQSGGLANMNDFSANLLRAIENGLSRDDALRALTIWPAEILGVADRLGTIEVGKIANLTVTRGDLFDRNLRIAHVFIDGNPVDLRTATASTAAGGASGTWTLNVNLGSGDIALTLILQQEGERLRGSIEGALGSREIANASASVGGDLRFTVPITFEGQTGEATFAGKINDNEMQGTVNVVGHAPGSFTGTRPATPPQPGSVLIHVGASVRGRPFHRESGALTEGRPYNFVKLGHYPQPSASHTQSAEFRSCQWKGLQ